MLRLPLTAVAALGAAAAIAGPAQAAPDWNPAADVTDGKTQFAAAHIGYTDGGTELGSHFNVTSTSPFDVDLVATRRRAGGAYETELTVPTTATAAPIDSAFDVAPNGAAVLAWAEADPKALDGPRRFRVAYRTPAGTWEQPTLIASDTSTAQFVVPSLSVAVGDDGTAVAGVNHIEADSPGELEPDGRFDVAVHPPNGAWDSGTRLSPVDQSSEFATVDVDASGAATAAIDQRTTEGATSSLNDDDSTLIVRRYSPSNRLWSGPEDITGSKPNTNVGAVQLDVDPAGRAVLAFQNSPRNAFSDSRVVRRFDTTAAFGSPDIVDSAGDASPAAVGIGPDGAAYVVTREPLTDTLGAARASATGAFSSVQGLGPIDGLPDSAVAFRGNDAFIAWEGKGGRSIRAAIWPSGAPRPDAARDLEVDQPVQGFTQVESDRDGSIVALWPSTGFSSRSATFDGGAPALTGASVPSSGQAGSPLAMSASFADLWSPLAGAPQWDFGDGTPATGGSVSHAYANAGTFTVRVRSRDARGNERLRTFPVTITAAPGAPAETPAADTVKPTVKFKLPAKKVRGKRSAWQTLKGTVADAAPSSGIARVEVQALRPSGKKFIALSGRRFATVSKAKARTKFVRVTPRGTTWKLKLPKLTRGTWTFRVRAVDKAGNVSKTVTQKVRLR